VCIELNGDKTMGETDELGATNAVGESKAEKPKPDEAKADVPKADEAKPDQSKADQPKGDKPKPDDSRADESPADEARIEKLLAVNRELGIFLEEQLDAVLALRKSVAAIEGFIQGDATLKKKYEKYLQGVKDEEANPAELHAASRIRGLLGRLQRAGTL
jgi:hypothetical protein